MRRNVLLGLLQFAVCLSFASATLTTQDLFRTSGLYYRRGDKLTSLCSPHTVLSSTASSYVNRTGGICNVTYTWSTTHGAGPHFAVDSCFHGWHLNFTAIYTNVSAVVTVLNSTWFAPNGWEFTLTPGGCAGLWPSNEFYAGTWQLDSGSCHTLTGQSHTFVGPASFFFRGALSQSLTSLAGISASTECLARFSSFVYPEVSGTSFTPLFYNLTCINITASFPGVLLPSSSFVQSAHGGGLRWLQSTSPQLQINPATMGSFAVIDPAASSWTQFNMVLSSTTVSGCPSQATPAPPEVVTLTGALSSAAAGSWSGTHEVSAAIRRCWTAVCGRGQ